MATSHEHARRETDPSGISLVGFGVDSGADGVVAPDTVSNDDSSHRFRSHELDYAKVLAQFRRAEESEAEAAYYGQSALQQEQARGPGYFVGLLRALATDRAAMVQRATDRDRSDVMHARDPARRRRRSDTRAARPRHSYWTVRWTSTRRPAAATPPASWFRRLDGADGEGIFVNG